MASNSVIRKKRGPKPTGKTPVLSLRLGPDITSALDTWISDQPEPRPSRSEAMRMALRDWLVGQGLLKAQALDAEQLEAKIADLDAEVSGYAHDEGTKSPANALKKMKRAVAKNEANKLRHKLSKLKHRDPEGA